MSEKGKTAREYFEQGYNCSQAVVLAFAPDLGLDEKTAVLVSSAFGGGMGRLREVCGTVSGMFMVLGMKYGSDSPDDYGKKKELYRRVQSLAEEFKCDNGSIICRDLLGLTEKKPDSYAPEKRSAEYYKKRPCSELVEYAANLLNEYIKQNPEDR